MRGSHAFTFAPGLPDAELSAVGAGSTRFRLSELDRQLIHILQQDGRRSFAAIARDLDVPEKTVRKRVHDLVETAIIQITTVSYPSLFGFGTIAMIGLTIDPAVPAKQVLQAFTEHPAIDYAVITTGRYNALVEVLCHDSIALLHFINDELPTKPGVRSVEVLPYMDLYYQEPAWEAAQSKPTRSAQTGFYELDPVDHQIMRTLHANGRLPFALVGKEVGLSESQVRKRVGRMIDEQVMRITAIVNPRSLGFDTVVWVAMKTTRDQPVGEVAAKLTQIPSITYVAITAGRFDILAEAVCRTNEDVMRLVDHEMMQLEGIADTELMFCLDLYYEAVQLPHEQIATTIET